MFRRKSLAHFEHEDTLNVYTKSSQIIQLKAFMIVRLGQKKNFNRTSVWTAMIKVLPIFSLLEKNIEIPYFMW